MNKISNSFNKFYWGAVISDILNNVDFLVWENIRFNIQRLDKNSLHELLKIMTFRGEKSLTEMDSKEVVLFLEEIRALLGENGFTLKVDVEEWDRTMKLIEQGQ